MSSINYKFSEQLTNLLQQPLKNIEALHDPHAIDRNPKKSMDFPSIFMKVIYSFMEIEGKSINFEDS